MRAYFRGGNMFQLNGNTSGAAGALFGFGSVNGTLELGARTFQRLTRFPLSQLNITYTLFF